MWNIALNTFRELKRNKILYMIWFFGILLIVFSLALASLSLWQSNKIILDFWLAMVEIFGLVSVIFIWSQLIFKEIEWKTIYLILSKPISRYEFILWKFIWFAMILASIIFFQSLIFLVIVWYSKSAFSIVILFSIIFIYLKLLVLFAIILFLSTFISSILSIVLTILIYFISGSISSIMDVAFNSKSWILYIISRVLYIVFPPFEALNLKSLILSQVPVNSVFVLLNSVYAIIYIILILTFTILIFNRKTFEN